MGREVRRVSIDWVHPKKFNPYQGKNVHRPLLDRGCMQHYNDPSEINPNDFMPEFSNDDRLGYCIYESVSEGTPLTPVFLTPEELAQWASDNPKAMWDQEMSVEGWLRFIKAGWAPSLIGNKDGLMTGVEFMARNPESSSA